MKVILKYFGRFKEKEEAPFLDSKYNLNTHFRKPGAFILPGSFFLADVGRDDKLRIQFL